MLKPKTESTGGTRKTRKEEGFHHTSSSLSNIFKEETTGNFLLKISNEAST